MPKKQIRTPKIITDWMDDHGDTEAGVLVYLRKQYDAWQTLDSPVVDFSGWLQLKLSCTPREARSAITWMQAHAYKET